MERKIEKEKTLKKKRKGMPVREKKAEDYGATKRSRSELKSSDVSNTAIYTAGELFGRGGGEMIAPLRLIIQEKKADAGRENM